MSEQNRYTHLALHDKKLEYLKTLPADQRADAEATIRGFLMHLEETAERPVPRTTRYKRLVDVALDDVLQAMREDPMPDGRWNYTTGIIPLREKFGLDGADMDLALSRLRAMGKVVQTWDPHTQCVMYTIKDSA